MKFDVKKAAEWGNYIEIDTAEVFCDIIAQCRMAGYFFPVVHSAAQYKNATGTWFIRLDKSDNTIFYTSVFVNLPVVPYQEFVECQEKITDFMTGDLFEMTSGAWFMLVGSRLRGVSTECVVEATSFDGMSPREVLFLHPENYQIKQVLRPIRPNMSVMAICNCVKGEYFQNFKVVYEKKEVKELTVKEISELLGYKVKVMGEDK